MESKNKIIHCAQDLFTRFGIKSVSMDDIASKLGISKKTIYNLLPTKNELVTKVIISHIEEEEIIIQDIVAKASNAIEEMIGITRHVQKFLKDMTPTLIYDLKKYYPEAWSNIEGRHFSFIRSIIKSNIQRGIQEGLYREDIHSEIVAKFYTRLSLSVADEEIFPSDQFSRHTLFMEQITYHIHGIVNSEGKKVLKDWESIVNGS